MSRPWKQVRSEIVGLEQITINLQETVDRVDREVNRKALRKAIKPALRQAKANARESDDTGTLRRSLGVKVKTYVRKRAITIYAGPRRGFARQRPNGQKQDPIRYGHLIELGRKNGSEIKATHFLERAFKSKRREAFDIWKREVKDGIPVAIGKVMRSKRRFKRGR